MVKKTVFYFFLLALVIPFCWSATADSGTAAQPQGKGRIVSAYWSDEAGNPVKTGYAGRPLLLSVETEGIADGETVKIDLYRDGAKSAAAETFFAEVRNNKCSAEWTYRYGGETLKSMPEYRFEASSGNGRKKSGAVKIAQKLRFYLLEDSMLCPVSIGKCYLTNGAVTQTVSVENGYFEGDLIPGEWRLAIRGKDFDFSNITFGSESYTGPIDGFYQIIPPDAFHEDAGGFALSAENMLVPPLYRGKSEQPDETLFYLLWKSR